MVDFLLCSCSLQSVWIAAGYHEGPSEIQVGSTFRDGHGEPFPRVLRAGEKFLTYICKFSF